MKATHSFFTKINYSACNEDSESERKALRLGPEDTVLCITGSGARALDLLVDQPKRILSIDFNATQNHLLCLKIAAYRALNYAEFKSFLGLDDKLDKMKLYRKVVPYLSLSVKAYWDQHERLIRKGVLYCGTWEHLLKLMSRLTFFRSVKRERLMRCTTIENQQEYWAKHWNNFSWRLFLKLISNQFLWKKIIREPGALLIPDAFDVYGYMNARFNYLAKSHLIRTNHFANLLFYGAYQEDCLLPIHLRKEYFEIIKRQVGKIEVLTDSLVNALDEKQLLSAVTAYSLSDFSSYADEEMYRTIWNKIVNHSGHNARFCERHFLIKREPDRYNKAILRDLELEKKLGQEDQAFIYSFCAGTINAVPVNKKTRP
jgi:S-adenosylmethionine-diacylglycerol 3-amino-3-carboxypropyl transferase